MTDEQMDAARDADELEPRMTQEEIEASVPEDARAMVPARTVGRRVDVLLWAYEMRERAANGEPPF